MAIIISILILCWTWIMVRNPDLNNSAWGILQPAGQPRWWNLRVGVITQPDRCVTPHSQMSHWHERALTSLVPFTKVKGHILAKTPELWFYNLSTLILWGKLDLPYISLQNCSIYKSMPVLGDYKWYLHIITDPSRRKLSYWTTITTLQRSIDRHVYETLWT